MQKIVAIDSQKLSAMQLCMRRFKLAFVENWTPDQRSESLERGSLIHDMLEVYYNCRKHQQRWHNNGKTHADVVESCIIAGRHAASKMSLEIGDVEEAIDTFQQYTTHFEHDYVHDANIVSIEQVAARVMYEDANLIILYQGKLDLVVAMQNYPQLPWDHKTRRRRVNPNLLNDQFIGYCWLLGVNNVMQNVIGMQKSLKPDEKFQRHLLSFPQNVIDEWVENAVWWVQHSLECLSSDFFPANYTSCDKWDGCVFRQICEAPKESRNLNLTRHFVQREWDVGTLL